MALPLMGITARDWLALLAENKFRVAAKHRGDAARLFMGGLVNEWRKRRQAERFGAAVAAAKVTAPVFILGHWRSGTTLLHELLACDNQFASPTLFQVSNPWSFLILEPHILPELEKLENERRQMDNMVVSYKSPGEDEFALATMCQRSPVIAWSFPRMEAFYDQYLTFCGAKRKDVERWQAALQEFAQALTVRYPGQTLLMKSPPHTARIRLLLELFPDARFIHIHREPYTVYSSTVKLYTDGVLPNSLQEVTDPDSLPAGILRRYRAMYEAYFEEVALIPPGQYVELSYEALDADKLGQVERLYHELNLPGFAAACDKVGAYVTATRKYKKNRHPDLAPELRERIMAAWRFTFDAWGYPV